MEFKFKYKIENKLNKNKNSTQVLHVGTTISVLL